MKPIWIDFLLNEKKKKNYIERLPKVENEMTIYTFNQEIAARAAMSTFFEPSMFKAEVELIV